MVKAIGLLLTASLLLVGAPAAAPAHASDDPAQRGPASVLLEGRGFGHGRGMSQYGAQSAASDHDKTYRQILRFYYPGLDLGRRGGLLEVLITGDTTDDVVVRDARDLVVRQVTTGKAWDLGYLYDNARRWKLTAAREGTATRVSVYTDRWRSVRVVEGEAEFMGSVSAPALVTPSGVRRYQGALRSAITPDGRRDTVNSVLMQDYLRGVVPREVPALWDPQAVQAQAVAARTYAAYYRAHAGDRYYDLCDTTSCQVYGGVGDSHPASDAAIRATSNEVLLAGGEPAFTEFSSSNGGWTVAGPVPYQVAKQDDWDPVNKWTYQVPATKIEAAYDIGDFQRLVVQERDGHGTWNGRVLRIRVVGSSGHVDTTGEAFRAKLSLRSSWFRQG